MQAVVLSEVVPAWPAQYIRQFPVFLTDPLGLVVTKLSRSSQLRPGFAIHAEKQSPFGKSVKVAGQLFPKAPQYVTQRPWFINPPQTPPPVGLAAPQRRAASWPIRHKMVSGNALGDVSLSPGLHLNPAHESVQSFRVGEAMGRK